MRILINTSVILVLLTALSGCKMLDNVNHYFDNFGCTFVGNCE